MLLFVFTTGPLSRLPRAKNQEKRNKTKNTRHRPTERPRGLNLEPFRRRQAMSAHDEHRRQYPTSNFIIFRPAI